MEGRRRWDELTSRGFGSSRAGASRPAFDEDYWAAVQDLFTRDLTGRGFVEFLQREPRETLRFLAGDLNLGALREKPWPVRYPLVLWRVFLATAHRLSPPRRILFAIATPILLLAWFDFLVLQGGLWRWPAVRPVAWLLISATMLLFLLVIELKDKLSLKGDLEVARQIQFGLLPFEPMERDGLSVRATMRPANTVGGDYFDVVELGPGLLGLAIGDVAGKGMPAALLMALLQGSLQTLITAGLRGPALMTKLNEHLCAQIPSNRLVTLFLAEIDLAGGELSYVNAGHNAPLILRQGAATESLGATGMALGILPDAPFEQARARFVAGERLVLYTDGITEAADSRDDDYGEARLVALVEGHRLDDPKALLDSVIADVLAHCGAARPGDDMTLLCVDRLPVGE
jgi:sigma-B regulation protein RsbU (phosphoserine phosphatase)